MLRRLSPSSRRAWIEILWLLLGLVVALVALLAEGVDRNTGSGLPPVYAFWSPSSRRAWIEITVEAAEAVEDVVALLAEGVDRNSCVCGRSIPKLVALLAEGVDRNQSIRFSTLLLLRRPPRGGRG